MNEKKQDLYIKKILQEDKQIPENINNLFDSFTKGESKNANKKIIKISLEQCLLIAASFVVVIFIGGNFYAQQLGKPNLISNIQAIFKSGNEISDEAIENTPEEINSVIENEQTNESKNVEETKSASQITKEEVQENFSQISETKTEFLASVFITHPNLPINNIMSEENIIGVGINLNDEAGSNINIYKTEFANELNKDLNTLEEIESYRINEDTIKTERKNINGEEWLLIYNYFDENVLNLKMYAIKNKDIYYIESYYEKTLEENINQILSTILIPEG